MKVIFIYGPDGSGKTFIAKQLLKKLDKSVIIPFEPGKFGTLIEEVDSGFNGEDSAVNKAIPLWKSTLFYIRYFVRYLFFYLRFHKKFSYAIFTRGPLEFGINNTHKNFPKKLGRWLQNIISKNCFVVIRPVETILREKPELPKIDILMLYEQYIITKCTSVINIEKDACVQAIIKKLK